LSNHRGRLALNKTEDDLATTVLLRLEMEKRHARVIEYSGGVSPIRKSRKSYTPSEKVAILRRHLIDHVPISDICDKYQLPPSIFYAWQKLFFENGASAFERKSGSPEQSHL
jgi:transposase-like protein